MTAKGGVNNQKIAYSSCKFDRILLDSWDDVLRAKVKVDNAKGKFYILHVTVVAFI